MHRLFVAIRPPIEIRRKLLDMMDGIRGARWQDDDQLHITLRFIGEADWHQAEDIALSLQNIHFESFDVALDGVGQFERRGRAHSLWIGLSPHDRLKALHTKTDSILRTAGMEPEQRAYRPHITIARLNAGSGPTGGYIADHAAVSSAPFSVDSICLYESFLETGGARYEVVERYPLA